MIDRVTVLFFTGTALFGAVLLAELYSGDANDRPVTTPAPVPEQTRPGQRTQSPPVDELVATSLARPLFSAMRRPTEQALANSPPDTELPNVRLTGIVIDRDRRSAIFAMQGAKPLVRGEGEMLSNWQLDSIAPRTVTLAGPTGTTTLEPKSDPTLVRPVPQAQPAPAAPSARPNLPVQPVSAGGRLPSPAVDKSPS